MQAVVLAGGLATRMRPRTEHVPKWLLPVRGRPFAAWQLDWLAGSGVDDVVACIGHLGDQIREEIGDDRAGVPVRYSEDGPDLVGTGGALKLAASRGLLADAFAVVYGDSYLPIRVSDVWAAFEADDRVALMTVYRNAGALDTSNARYADGVVQRYRKGNPDADPSLEYIDYGLTILRRSALDELPEGSSDLSVLMEALSDRGGLGGYEVHERFYEIGSPAGLEDLEAHLAGGSTIGARDEEPA